MRAAPKVVLARPSLRCRDEFIGAARRSRKLHGAFAHAPDTDERFGQHLAGARRRNREVFWLRHGDDRALVGVVTADQIVRGLFQSAYLGYYAFVPYAGRGCMRAGLALVLDRLFDALRLHRVEANIQPDNEASKRLVRGLGFQLEGYSPKYLKIGGVWRDHERWALLVDDWRAHKRARHR